MIKKCFLLFYSFIYVNYAQLLSNLIHLNDKRYPFVLFNSDNNYYYVITSGESLKIHKESFNIERIKTNDFSHEPLYCYYNSKNNYIYESNKIYYIDYNPSINIIQINNFNSLKGNYVGCIPQNNDFIIYGIDSNNLIFLSASQYSNHKLENNEDISEKISCKHLIMNGFICASIYKNKINIIFFYYNINNSYKTLTFIQKIPEDNDKNFINLALYDTNDSTTKILCKQNEGILDINCVCFKIGIDRGNIVISKYTNQINIKSSSNDFSEKDCSFSEFNDEYLFCCGVIDSIKCFRFNLFRNLNIIKTFEIEIKERNTYLKIRVYNLCVSIFFMNNNNSVHEYIFYKPICNNKVFTFGNILDQNMEEEIEESLSNLFIVKTYYYYLKFFEPPALINNNIEILLNSQKLDFDKRVNIHDKENNINFILKKNVRNYDYFYINYRVSIGNDKDDFYEQQCTIEFKKTGEKEILDVKNCEIHMENYIMYGNDCYKIINPSIKSFYDDKENKESSCFQKFKLYIKEDSNECGLLSSIGYYISNVETGLLSKCHENCLSCYNGIR